MNWYQVFAKGHHGYPQPEDSYEAYLYESACLHCGIHGSQSGPIRVRSTSKAPHSHFIQPNWLFDVFLVRPEVEALLVAEGIKSISFKPVVEHRSGTESAHLRQLCIHEVIACAETSRLPKVTCVQNNEESKRESPGPKRYPPETPYCGQVKWHPPTSLVLSLHAISTSADVFQSMEWFGSGGKAFRITICSERFVALVQKHKLRGIGFNPAKLSGHSERAT